MSRLEVRLNMFWNNVSNNIKMIKEFPKYSILKSATVIKIKQPVAENEKTTIYNTNSRGYQKTIRHRKMRMK